MLVSATTRRDAMTEFPVVVGVKDGQHSALRFAAEVAAERGVGLRVLHCVELLASSDAVSLVSNTWPAPGQEVLDNAKAFVDALASPPADANYMLVIDSPYATLADEATEASLVVVGTDAESMLEGFFRGRVTERLLKHAVAPVAVVPDGSWPTSGGGGVFVAVDARTSAAGALQFAFDEAQRRDRQLHVVHVAPVGVPFEELEPMRAAVSEILAGWSEQYPDVTVTRRFLFDEADEGCLRASAEADLLVLGRSGHTEAFLPFAHPVLAQIARHAHCPCVVVPSAEGESS
jgi:nucleotide-binding universal stress UspA family protein